jgi:hypothetical protein
MPFLAFLLLVILIAGMVSTASTAPLQAEKFVNTHFACSLYGDARLGETEKRTGLSGFVRDKIDPEQHIAIEINERTKVLKIISSSHLRAGIPNGDTLRIVNSNNFTLTASKKFTDRSAEVAVHLTKSIDAILDKKVGYLIVSSIRSAVFKETPENSNTSAEIQYYKCDLN